jgi:signal transduction histidine kinase
VIDNILRLLPDTTHLFVVLGASLLEQSWRDVVRRESSRYPQLTFDWASGSFSDVLKHAAMLPGHSAILYGLFNLDAEGAAYDEEHVLAELHAVATAPLFGFQSHQLGYGIVGGSLIPLDEVSHHTVDVAVRMVNGEPPGHIKTFVLAAAHPTFDWRELRRWHINESRLPSGSLVRLREPTIWQRSKWLWLTGGAIGLVEGLLIVGLVVNLHKRKQTERSLLENVTDQKAAQSALSSLSRRLMEAQDEERARVARNLHDDVGQQLGYLAFELGLLQREDRHRRKADRVLASALNLVRNASKSVHDLSYQLHPAKLGLMGLVPVISSLVRELSQPTLSIAFIHESVPVGLPDDIALCLFRVVQEALRNVMTHSAATQVSVQLRGATEGLTLSIADNGVGFDVDRIRTSGLGFPGMEERLRSVGGRCQIRSRPGAGTTLDVVVPLPATPRTIH